MTKSFEGLLPGLPTARIPADSSGEESTSKVVFAQPCIITCVKIFTDGTNDATVELYNSASGEEGSVIDKWLCVGDDKWGGGALPFPLFLSAGCYAKITGTGGSYIIHYVDLKR